MMLIGSKQPMPDVCEGESGGDIYGNILFRGITRETKAKFIRMSENKAPKEAWEIISQKWKLGQPSLVISVTGGARDFNLHDNLRESFKATIQKASQLPGACIISGGTYTGVMKLVSDAFQRGAGVCLGIAAWDSIIDNDVSIKNDRHSPYVVGSWLSEKGLYLDYKHTHFILVKESNLGQGEMKFRAGLERYLVEKQKVPTVMLVLNGGWGTLETIHEVLSNGSCPIVLVQKSGRIADLFVYGLKEWYGIMEKKKEGKNHPGLYRRMKYVLRGIDDEIEDDELKEIYKKLIECLDNRDMFSVAEMGSENDIDVAVVKALLARNQEDPKATFAKLKLTLLWNRADYARTNIFSARTKIKDADLSYMMVMALSRGNLQYVQLLMDYGVNMFELLTTEILEFLYGYQSYEDNFPLKQLGDMIYKDQDYNGIDETDRKFRRSLSCESIKTFMDEHFYDFFMDNEILLFNAIEGSDKFEDPFWELFMWAVFCNLPDMAKFLWPFGKDQIAKALIATEIWQILSKLEENRGETTRSLKEGSRFFSLLSHRLLDTCYAIKETETIQLITTTLRQVPNMTCLDIAGAVKHYEFIAHSCVQTLLTDVWTGQMEKRHITWLDNMKIWVGLIFPFLVVQDIKLNMPRGYKVKDKACTKPSNTASSDYLRKLKSFYFDTPIVTFILHVHGSILFLILYSYIVMMHKLSTQKSWLEILLILWVFGHLVAEIYQISQYDTKSFKKCQYWLSDDYNKFDAFNITILFISWAMSFDEKSLQVAHTLHSINCGCWILRVLTVIRIHSTLGLYLEMIQEMLKELFWFLFILFAVILAYGITSTSLLFPGIKDPMICLRMFMRSWFHIYGEYFLEITPDKNSTHLITPVRNSYDEYIVWVIFGFYLLLTNILLLNIIIAAFNTTYADVQTKAAYISKYRRYDLIVEYSKKSSTPPPLSLLHHCCLFIRWIYSCCLCGTQTKEETTKLRRELPMVNYSDMEELREFEYYCAMQLYQGSTEAVEMSPESDSHCDVSARIDILQEKLMVGIEKMDDKILEVMHKMDAKMWDLDKRMLHIDQQQENISKMLSSDR